MEYWWNNTYMENFHLVLKLRMSGDTPLLPLHVFMVLTGTNIEVTEMICSVYLQIDGKL